MHPFKSFFVKSVVSDSSIIFSIVSIASNLSKNYMIHVKLKKEFVYIPCGTVAIQTCQCSTLCPPDNLITKFVTFTVVYNRVLPEAISDMYSCWIFWFLPQNHTPDCTRWLPFCSPWWLLSSLPPEQNYQLWLSLRTWKKYTSFPMPCPARKTSICGLIFFFWLPWCTFEAHMLWSEWYPYHAQEWCFWTSSSLVLSQTQSCFLLTSLLV